MPQTDMLEKYLSLVHVIALANTRLNSLRRLTGVMLMPLVVSNRSVNRLTRLEWNPAGYDWF